MKIRSLKPFISGRFSADSKDVELDVPKKVAKKLESLKIAEIVKEEEPGQDDAAESEKDDAEEPGQEKNPAKGGRKTRK